MVEYPSDPPPAASPSPSDEDTTSGPFEGPEKLLEIWFAPYPPAINTPNVGDNGAHDVDGVRTGLRTVPRKVWEDMLDIVKCKVLSTVAGREMDAYLLSESSFFVFPHKLILKTCGTTLNLLGLPRILSIAAEYCSYTLVWRCFYSRKSFMFPERQIGPHREWRNEVEYLDALFDNGAAYTVGKMNGDHWLLYMTTPPEEVEEPGIDTEVSAETEQEGGADGPSTLAPPPPPAMSSSVASSATLHLPAAFSGQDYTLELLMTKLGTAGRRPFLFHEEDLPPSHLPHHHTETEIDDASKAKGAHVSQQLGIDAIFPRSRTRLDSYGFDPCGYSANALVDAGSSSSSPADADHPSETEGYYTIHVTPEEGWSYASFECNVPVHPSRRQPVAKNGEPAGDDDAMPDLETLIQRVVNIFQPGHLTLTLFVSNDSSSASSSSSITSANEYVQVKEHETMVDIEPTSVEIAQRAFRRALMPRGYRRTDKINYEFGDYDLAFATFAKK